MAFLRVSILNIKFDNEKHEMELKFKETKALQYLMIIGVVVIQYEVVIVVRSKRRAQLCGPLNVPLRPVQLLMAEKITKCRRYFAF